MSMCADCIHNDICGLKDDFYYQGSLISEMDDVEVQCNHFKSKNRWIEIPCKTGDTLYCDGEHFAPQYKGQLHNFKVTSIVTEVRSYFRGELDYCFGFDSFGETVFTSRKEALEHLNINKK